MQRNYLRLLEQVLERLNIRDTSLSCRCLVLPDVIGDNTTLEAASEDSPDSETNLARANETNSAALDVDASEPRKREVTVANPMIGFVTERWVYLSEERVRNRTRRTTCEGP